MKHSLQVAALALAALPATALAQAQPIIDTVEFEDSICSRASDEQRSMAARAGVPTPARSCEMYSGGTMSWAPVAYVHAYEIEVWADFGEGIEYLGSYETKDTSLELSGGPADAYYLTVRADAGRGLGDADRSVVVVNHIRPESTEFPQDREPGDAGAECHGEAELLEAIDALVASHWAADAELRQLRAERDAARHAMTQAELDARQLRAANARLQAQLSDLRRRVRAQEDASKSGKGAKDSKDPKGAR